MGLKTNDFNEIQMNYLDGRLKLVKNDMMEFSVLRFNLIILQE